MKVSGWKNGSFVPRRKIGLGVNVGRDNATTFFDRRWTHVLVQLDRKVVTVKLSGTFWTTCPELRSSSIGDWMREKGLVPWKVGNPPRMSLICERGNRFKLSLSGER